MKQSVVFKASILFGSLILAYVVVLMPVFAHGDGDGHDEAAISESIPTPERERLEQLLALLKQVMVLLTTLQSIQSHDAAEPVTTLAMPAVPGAVDEHAEMDEHHDEHGHTETTDETEVTDVTPHLVIELETHTSGTHAHVRYVDKPEEMFFVPSAITNEEGLISDIVAKTGLTAEEVREALKYL